MDNIFVAQIFIFKNNLIYNFCQLNYDIIYDILKMCCCALTRAEYEGSSVMYVSVNAFVYSFM